jgi:gentisate 1,2-dioxygenase
MDFSEYYIIIFGSMKAIINDIVYIFSEWDFFRVDAWDIHRVIELNQEDGCRYIVVKEKTYEWWTVSIPI